MAGPAAPEPLSRHHARLTLGLIGLALLPRAAASQTAVDPRGRYAEVAGALTPTIERLRAQHGIPAISLALVDGSRIVWARGFGWADSAAGVAADAATVYRVGSVSKLFTDMAVMQLVERRELALDAPVRRYLPDFQPTNPFGGEITLRELTSHRSGLTREPPVGHYFDDTQPTLAATVASLNGTKLVYPPATHTKYSNAGVAVLGYVLERTRGEPFGDYLQHTVLEPMGMSQSAFEPLPRLEPHLADGTDVDASRPALRRAHVPARRGARRQPLHQRPRPRPLPVRSLRRWRHPRRPPGAGEGHARLDVDTAIRVPGRHQRHRDRLLGRSIEWPPRRRTRWRDLRLRHHASRAARTTRSAWSWSPPST